jgi:D-alanyl-lipoteichoic acid acyltransferase DltB (MBOAT superfamily)
MLFNSIDFAIFFPIVFCLYWLIDKYGIKYQNAFILISSYFFYGWWDWRFLGLIIFSSFIDFSIGLQLDKTSIKSKRKLLLFGSILVNLGMLASFKYYNFFITSFSQLFTFLGVSLNSYTLNIILPVGISFYTFQTLSYTIDVYNRKLNPTKDIISFFAFVSFFPQLVAGPIERATNLLPQFYKKRYFNYSNAVEGLKQILWGLFKKVVIADNCAGVVNYVFANSTEMEGSSLLVGVIFFSFQIYGDFSGYSDIAIGISKLFGFSLMKNFAFPYFSRDIAEFWRRWHISLSTWFRDYLYIPLGGSAGGVKSKVRNTFIIFIVSGFWHGANWTFIVWGALNALYFLPLLLSNSNRKNMEVVAADRGFVSFRELVSILSTFAITAIAWVFFRAENLHHAFEYLNGLSSISIFSVPSSLQEYDITLIAVLIVVMIMVEWKDRKSDFGLQSFASSWGKSYRYILYYSLCICIIWFSGEEQEFIYFQF